MVSHHKVPGLSDVRSSSFFDISENKYSLGKVEIVCAHALLTVVFLDKSVNSACRWKTPIFRRPANLPAPSQTGQKYRSAFVLAESIPNANRVELTSFSCNSAVGGCDSIGYYDGSNSLFVSQLTTDEDGILGRIEWQHQI